MIKEERIGLLNTAVLKTDSAMYLGKVQLSIQTSLELRQQGIS